MGRVIRAVNGATGLWVALNAVALTGLLFLSESAVRTR